MAALIRQTNEARGGDTEHKVHHVLILVLFAAWAALSLLVVAAAMSGTG